MSEPTTCLTCGFEIRGSHHQGEMCRAITAVRADRDELHQIADKRGDLIVEQQIRIAQLERERDAMLAALDKGASDE